MKKDYEHIVTLWPAGREGQKRILVFSPHPDDDVIAMGGTIHRLVEQGHEVHIAYQTSGNIAVSDEDVERYIQEHLKMNDQKEWASYIDKEGKILSAQCELAVKGMVRRDEALAACQYNGISEQQVHFLNMPFYETGQVVKKPLGDGDIAIIRRLLEQVKPHQIYIAGDFNDPHDTHRKCTEAIVRALKIVRTLKEVKVSSLASSSSAATSSSAANNNGVDTCQIWLYNGAWDEWPLEQIDMAVPMTHEELMHKRGAILKHQSQMENAPYKGGDQRLFWQRSEQRNRKTAQQFAEQGVLPQYEAMEAFVEYKEKFISL